MRPPAIRSPLQLAFPRSQHGSRKLLAALASLALLAAACSGTDEDVVATADDTESGTTEQSDAPSTEGAAEASDGDAMASPEDEETEAPPPDGDVLPASTFDAEAVTIDGQSYDLSQLAGTDVILWFWAPW